ncbi:MAG TPA: cell wall-binding repeat-containing protein [Egibacteraceae bacterium]|nr:cell wall-binding repeat-containing protein [Egibacteraceae bacterium]
MHRLPALLLALLLFAPLGASPAVAESVEPTTIVERIAGPDRISTAAAVSRSSYERADTVVLARADDYADALAGATLARALDAPILLSSSTHISAATRQELLRLGAGSLVLLGGRAALGRGVEEDARTLGLSLRRIGGPTRFHTAALVADALAVTAGSPDCGYLAQGADASPSRGWPDALAVGALAAAQARPLLLTVNSEVPAPTINAIEKLGLDCLMVVGGTASISDDALDQLRSDGVTLQRIAGETRFDTAAKVADLAVASGIDPATVYVATGLDFPDGLAAGPTVAMTGGVLLLVDGREADRSQPAIRWLAQRQGVSRIRVIGGQGAVSVEFQALLAEPQPRRPGPHSTGPRIPSDQLQSSGGLVVTKDGAVVEGLDIAGTLVIDANDVVVRDTRVRSSARYPVRAMAGTSGTVIEYAEIDGEYSLDNNGCIQGPHLTVRHSELRRCTDGAKVGSGSLYEHNWIHDPTRDDRGADANHIDGLQSTGGDGITIRGNYIDVIAADGHPSNSAIIQKSDFVAITDCLIEGNWLNGGNYTIFLREGDHGPPTGCAVRGNRFGRDFRYGLLSTDGDVEVSGNVWDDDGSFADGR